MKVLVIGSGGREHALCHALRGSASVTELYCAPGNPGIAELAHCLPIEVGELEKLATEAEAKGIDLTVVGPEDPLSRGIVDTFQLRGLAIFGPTQAAARIESSKAFAKEIMQAAGVLTAGYQVCRSPEQAIEALTQFAPPYVIKCDSLAAGKGVFISSDERSAHEAIIRLFSEFTAEQVVIEQFLQGREISVICATDGNRIVTFPAAHDYKRLGDHDVGPNTGGMGTVCPTPRFNPALLDAVEREVFLPVLNEMKKRSIPFVGFLYAGLMITDAEERYVLEFNARFGDPETQVILPLVACDWGLLLLALTNGGALPQVTTRAGSACCVVLASEGYPDAPKKGVEITGLEFASQLADTLVFHAGTAFKPFTSGSPRRFDAACVTNGGRVLGVVGIGEDLVTARHRAYRGADMIQFRGRQLRRDIGER